MYHRFIVLVEMMTIVRLFLLVAYAASIVCRLICWYIISFTIGVTCWHIYYYSIQSHDWLLVCIYRFRVYLLNGIAWTILVCWSFHVCSDNPGTNCRLQNLTITHKVFLMLVRVCVYEYLLYPSWTSINSPHLSAVGRYLSIPIYIYMSGR